MILYSLGVYNLLLEPLNVNPNLSLLIAYVVRGVDGLLKGSMAYKMNREKK